MLYLVSQIHVPAPCWFCCLRRPLCINTQVLPSLKGKKAVMCLVEKICVINKLCSGLSYSAVGPEFMLMNQQSRHPSFYCPSQIPCLANRRPVAALRPPSAVFLQHLHTFCLCDRNLTLHFLQGQQFSNGQVNVHREFIKHNCHE